VRHTTQPDEGPEVAGHELRPIVRDDPRGRAREDFTPPLPNRLDIGFGHLLTNLPVHDMAAVAIENGAKIVKGAADIQTRDSDVPMLVRPMGLDEILALITGVGVRSVIVQDRLLSQARSQ
jgi:hypothetical protein